MGLSESTRLTITASDGAEPAARLALADEPGAPGVVVLHDARGLHSFYEHLADRLGAAGAHALAIDLYARTAGTAYRDDSFDVVPHRAALRDATMAADVSAALETLQKRGATEQYVLGFSLGGRAAQLQGTRDDVAGVIGFYCWPTRELPDGSSPVAEARAGRLRAASLTFFGGADEAIPAADRSAYLDALASAGVRHESQVYDGAPHGFFDKFADDYQTESADAWGRILNFVGIAAK